MGYRDCNTFPFREESTMASVSFNARERRLVVENLCWPEDAPGLAAAIGASADPDNGLVVDLTRMPYVPREVAVAITEARRRAESRGCRVRVWTDPDTSTAATIAAAYADSTP